MFTSLKKLIKSYRTDDSTRAFINAELRQLTGYFLLWLIVYIVYVILV